MRVVRFDHVQLAMPAGGEDDARAFYEGLLGLAWVPKPGPLAGRGGCWFESGDLRLHLGVDPGFHPARKAHPALIVEGLRFLVADLAGAGITATEDGQLDGFDRVFVDDPFGNRLELMEPDRRGT